jgi:hypothetical protein
MIQSGWGTARIFTGGVADTGSSLETSHGCSWVKEIVEMIDMVEEDEFGG